MKYQKIYNDYWSLPRKGEPLENVEMLARKIIYACGLGNVLDIGCGEGFLVKTLPKFGVEAQGVDVSDVALAGKHSDRLHHGSVLELPFPDNFFDVVTCINCLEYLEAEDIPLALAEIRRVCRRHLFLQVVTASSGRQAWVRTIQDRGVWEQALFAEGFRKSLRGPLVQAFTSFENEASSATILMEKVSAKQKAAFPLERLLEERDLHMDMMRETGRRSDAHLARYAMACEYVRPGDKVLDAACGLGYGSAILYANTPADSVLGLDNSEFSIRYANEFYGEKNVVFREHSLPDLSFLEDESVDVIVSFETLEHLKEPEHFLKEVQRVLIPGGRFVCSVPNLWVDESGDDPNPWHFHVFDLPRLYELISKTLLPEAAYAQVAGGGMTLTDQPRSLKRISDEECFQQNTEEPAEWWLMVAMKDPWSLSEKPYRETVFPEGKDTPPNETAFAMAYENPWLVRSMVSMGIRATSPILLEQIAQETLKRTSPGSVDTGAALCVLLYLHLNANSNEESLFMEQAKSYIAAETENPQILRWQISLTYVLALLYRQRGEMKEAFHWFESCAKQDALAYSPLLATKTVDACLQAARLRIAQNEFDHAITFCQQGLAIGQNILTISQHQWVIDIDTPPAFAWRELTAVFDLVQLCSSMLQMLQAKSGWSGWQETAASYSLCNAVRSSPQDSPKENHSHHQAIKASLVSLDNSDASALENLSHHLSDELNRRTYALFRQQPEIEQMKQQLHLLKKAVRSAEEWQKRGRIKRAFHQWKAPEGILENLLVDSKTPVAIEKKPSLSPKTEIKNLKKQVRDLQKTVKSATQWQKRSWIKRAFHKWKPPGQS